MAYIIPLDPDDFRKHKPQFSNVSDEAISDAYYMATSFFRYNKHLPNDPLLAKVYLYALMCHILTLMGLGENGQTGYVSSATEGSVSVSFALPTSTRYLDQYFNQTYCGQLFWSWFRRFAFGGRIYKKHTCEPHG